MTDKTKIVKVTEEAKEVWWERTLEYKLEVDGIEYEIRYNESPKWTNIYVWDGYNWLEDSFQTTIPEEVFQIANMIGTECMDAGEIEMSWNEKWNEWTL